MMALDFFKMLSKDWLAEGADHTTVWENGMGSGPFTPGDLVKDVSISLERNPNYFKEGLPYVDGYTQFVISDASTAISAFQTGQVFMSIWGVTNISGAQSEKLEADTNGRIKDFFIPDAQIEGLAMNQKKDTPVSDVRVRRALFLAVHRPAFVEAFGGSQGQVGTPFPPGSWFGRSAAQVNDLPGYRVTANGEKHPDDIKAATDLLAAAGFDDGNKLKIDLLIRQTAGRQDIAALVKDQLERSIPVEMTLIPIDPSAGIQAYIAGDYEVAMEGTAVPLAQPDPIMSKIYMPGGLWAAWAGWDTPNSFVTLFNQQSEELDESARAALVRQIEDFILNEDPGPTIPLFWKPWDWLVNVEEVNNFHTSPSLFAQFKYEHLWLTNP
jgi:ABC-type transport system substrate-binding protein